MAAITTIENPLVTDEVQVLSYWNNSNGDLVLYQRSAHEAIRGLENEPVFTSAVKTTDTKSPAADANKLMNPSSITGFMHRALPNVYGIINDNVYRISPVTAPVGSAANIDKNTPSLAGCSDGHLNAWLYFYKASSDSDQNMVEWTVGGGISSAASLANIRVDESSYLAAVYLGGEDHDRRLFFQSPDGSDGSPGGLNYADPTSGMNGPVAKTDNVRKASPLAACLGNTDTEHQARVYLYYVSNVNTIYRSVSLAGNPEKWDTPVEVDKMIKFKVSKFSQVAVTPSVKDRTNYLTYVSNIDGVQKFRMFADPWKI